MTLSFILLNYFYIGLNLKKKLKITKEIGKDCSKAKDRNGLHSYMETNPNGRKTCAEVFPSI